MKALIREKFGNDYVADETTFIMGIDQRFTAHFAERFKDLVTLETCTGAGFTTIALAKVAKHIFSVDINKTHQEQAKQNLKIAGLASNVTFRNGSILESTVLENIPSVEAVFIDPDWAVSGPEHVYRFKNSNTLPPADAVLEKMFHFSKNVAIILPPLIDHDELASLPEHECEKLYLGDSHELYCLYFGSLIRNVGNTIFRVLM